jgi:hypothetical protein
MEGAGVPKNHDSGVQSQHGPADTGAGLSAAAKGEKSD